MANDALEGKHISEIQRLAEKFQNLMHEGYAGKAGTKPDDVDQAELKAGIKVELEHTDNPRVSRKIALDHLTEFSRAGYYKVLAQMEYLLRRMENMTEENRSRKLEALRSFVRKRLF